MQYSISYLYNIVIKFGFLFIYLFILFFFFWGGGLRLPLNPPLISTLCRTLQWRHNELDGVSNHRRLDCLLKRLFWRRSKKTSKLRVTCPHKGPVTWKMFPFDDAIMVDGSPTSVGLCVCDGPVFSSDNALRTHISEWRSSLFTGFPYGYTIL